MTFCDVDSRQKLIFVKYCMYSMSSYQSIELYDPESPSVDDDLCLELDKSTTCKGGESAASAVDFYTDTEDAEDTDYNQKLSSTEDSLHSEVTTVLGKEECALDVVQAEKPVKPLVANKPAVIWKSTKKILRHTVKEFNDVQTAKDDTMKAPVNATFIDTSTHLPHFGDHQKLQSCKQLQHRCSNKSSSVTADSINSAACDIHGVTSTSKVSTISEPVTTENRIHECSVTLQRSCILEPNSIMLNNSTKSIVEIAEPAEPCDVDDQTLTFSQEPRTIKLSRIVEDPSEPDDLLQISDPDCNSQHVTCPQIIRLDRAKDFGSHAVAQSFDSYISDPSEPTDIEPSDGENIRIIPKEIKLHRADDSKNLIDFAFIEKQNSSSLIKPRIIQLNTLHAETDMPVADPNSVVNMSDITAKDEKNAYCQDTPLSPTESIKSVSDGVVFSNEPPLSPTESVKSVSNSELDERQATKFSMPEVNVFESCEFLDITAVENKCLLSRGSSVKSVHSVSSRRYLSDGEIVDDEDEEPFGIFQISASAPFSENNKENCEQCEKKSGKKRLFQSVVVGHSKPENGPDGSERNKRQKVLGNACSPTASAASCVNEHSDKSIKTIITPKSKTIINLASSEKRKHKKRKQKLASRSSEQFLVRDFGATKRKVVVINKTGDKSKKNKHQEPCNSSSLVVTDEIPSFSHHNLPEKVQKFKKRTSDRRKLTAKRRRQHHIRRNESSHVRKRKGKHKRHKHRKHRSDGEDSLDVLVQRHSRSRSRSYNRIVEMIRSEERQQSPNMHRLQSVVVHKNSLVSARQRSSSDSSHDSHHCFDNFTLTDIRQNPDSRSQNMSDGPMHLSRLSYSGLLDQDGHTTLLGECIKSKCGSNFDINFVSRNLTNVFLSTDDDVEIVGVSYAGEMQPENNNIQNADISSQQRDDFHGVVEPLLTNSQSAVAHVEKLSSGAGEKSVGGKRPTNDGIAEKIESKKVTVSSKEVQTQESLFAETQHHVTKGAFSSNSKQFSDHSKADKELQVSDFDNDEECIYSVLSTQASGCNTVLSEVASGIQSPESHVEEVSYVPRPVLLERTDVKSTPDSPKQEFSDICVTVPNVSETMLSRTKTIALERVAESDGELLPQVSVSGSRITFDNATEQLQLGAIAASCTEISNKSSAGLVLRKSGVNAAEQLSYRNSDSNIVEQLPEDSNARRKEQYQLSNSSVHVTAPAVHHLPPLILHKPLRCQRAVPLRRVNPFTENQPVCSTDSGGPLQQLSITKQPTITVSGHNSAVRLSHTSAFQQLPSEPAVAISRIAQLQQPLIARTLSDDTSDSGYVPAVPSLSVFPQVHHDTHTARSSSGLSESLSFFTLKSDRIPGICEDVEPDISQYESRFGMSSSSYQNSLVPSSLIQTSGSLDVVNVVATAAATAESEIQQPTITASCGAISPKGLASAMTTDSLPFSPSEAGSAYVRHSIPQSNVVPTAAVNSGNSAMQQSIAPILPLLGTIATQLFKVPLQPQSATVAASSTIASVIPAVSSSSSVVTVPTLKHATSTFTSTDTISAWITSLPKSMNVEKPQISSRPPEELDFDVDAVVSPRSDEIMSFSPPSSEHMMAVVKMKHTLGLKKKSSKNATSNLKNPAKTETVSDKIFDENMLYLCML